MIIYIIIIYCIALGLKLIFNIIFKSCSYTYQNKLKKIKHLFVTIENYFVF